MKRRRRVYAYITCDKGVLILEHPEHPDAGLQVPGGTVETGETPEEAVIREVYEETNLSDVSIKAQLGYREFDMSPYDMQEMQEAWFYHLHCHQAAEDEWFHEESFGKDGPIPFRLYWAKLPYEGPSLIAHHGLFLGSLS